MIRRRFFEWLDAMDVESRKASTSAAAWVPIVVFVALILCLTSVLPFSREYFALSPVWPLVFFVPTATLGLVGGCRVKNDRMGEEVFGLLLLLGNSGLQLAFGSMAALSRMPGAAVMAALYVLVVAVHCQVMRVSLRLPFGLLPAFVSWLSCLLLSSDAAHWAMFAVVGPGAIGAGLVMGTTALSERRLRQQTDALKEVVRAQMLEERAQQASVAGEKLMRVLQNQHDAANALSTALLNAQLLRPRLSKTSQEDEQRMMAELCGALERLQSLLDRKNHLDAPALEADALELHGVLKRTSAEAAARYRDVRFHVECPLETRVLVRGGELALTRMLENVMLNACEGDGLTGAAQVHVSVSVDGDRVAVSVDDDGPGFAPGLLLAPVTGFQTTKPYGTGLGLYTTERLLRVSEGKLERSNRAPSGARVRLTLPRATQPSATSRA